MVDPLARKVEDAITRRSMVDYGDRIVAAVSGGPDSVALLSVLLELQEDHGLSIIVAHLNHGLREEESDQDQEFVEKLARGRCLPFEAERIQLHELRRKWRLSIQEAAREARYRFLERVRERWNADRIALGHHADDQVESVMMAFLRGSGSRGLSGIPPKRDNTIIRPLIETRKVELLSYLERKGIGFRQDRSNLQTNYLRNRVRMELLPYLKERFNPQIESALLRVGEIARWEDDFLQKEAEKYLQEVMVSADERRWVLDNEKLSALHPAVLSRLLRHVIGRLMRGRNWIPFPILGELMKLQRSCKPNARINLPRGLTATREYRLLKIEKGRPKPPPSYSYPIEIPGMVSIPEVGKSIFLDLLAASDKNSYISRNPAVVYMDADALARPLLLRNVSEGDRFVPFGMKGTKKIKDLLIDLKVPLEERRRIPVLVAGEIVAWVVGVRMDERIRVTETTRKVVQGRVEAWS